MPFCLPILIWILDGFLSALLILIILSIIGVFVLQISKKKRIYNGNNGHWDVDCPKCSYHEFVTLEEHINWRNNYIYLKIKCKRCNKISFIRLKDFK